MRLVFLLLVIGFILAEAAVYVLVGSAIGIFPTLGLGLLSMIAGAVLLRRQGLATVLRMRAEAAAGRLPAATLLEGAVLAVAALLMILPGFITDVIGLLLFIPAVRGILGRRIRNSLETRLAQRRQARPTQAPVVELDRSQYAFEARPESPWRPNGADR